MEVPGGVDPQPKLSSLPKAPPSTPIDRKIALIPEQLRAYMERSIGIVTALNPVLGYERATELAAEALEENKGLLELVREKGLLSEEQIRDLLDPRKMTGQ